MPAGKSARSADGEPTSPTSTPRSTASGTASQSSRRPRELQAAITNALRATGKLDDFELAALVHAGVMKKVPSPPPQLPRGSREASGPPPGFRGAAPPPPARPSLRPSSAPPSEGSSGSRPASRRSSTPPASSAPTPDRHGPSGRSPARRRRPAPPPGTRSPTICGESGTTWSYRHPVYLRARAEAFARSRGICQGCGQQPAVQAHHWALHYPPAPATTADDLIALCAFCHCLATTIRRFTRAGGSRHQFLALLSEALAKCDLNSPLGQ